MSDETTTDHVDSMVKALVEMQSDSGSRTVPMASTDADEVIKSQLTENTGRHLLDSGSAYGRHWEENQDNPPWEKPEWNVSGYDPEDGYVTHNVYDFMHWTFGRDELAVALEVALYAFGNSSEQKRESWLTTMEEFATMVASEPLYRDELSAMNIPDAAIEDVLGHNAELRSERSDGTALTHNTYNSECHSLSQCLQATTIGGLYAEYVLVQVHGGCDIRGGYTAPRVYSAREHWTPMELHFDCTRCGWNNAESCVIRGDNLLWLEEIDPAQIDELVQEHYPDHYGEDEWRDISADIIEELHEQEHIDGGLLHKCDRGLGVAVVN
jgi:hypothetical protein